MTEQFQDGDIVRQHDDRQRFRLHNVKLTEGKYGHAGFTPVKKDGTRDRRFDVGFSGSLYGYVLVERAEQHQRKLASAPDHELATLGLARAQVEAWDNIIERQKQETEDEQRFLDLMHD